MGSRISEGLDGILGPGQGKLALFFRSILILSPQTAQIGFVLHKCPWGKLEIRMSKLETSPKNPKPKFETPLSARGSVLVI